MAGPEASSTKDIRRAGPADLAALLVLVREFYVVDQHDFDEVAVTRALTGLLADDRYGIVLLAEQPEPVGYAVVTWSYSLESGGRDCCLDELYLRVREQGLGGVLLEAALDAARAAGVNRMFLETEAHNARVRRFYVRHGFQVEDSVWLARLL